jgi:UDP-2,3-diacylglucosamine pyrophosphatase LpxH
MPEETVYFVSDTHLGDGTGADRFCYPTQLLGLLQKIEGEPNAHLVLLGDFLELWATSLKPVLIKHAPIFFLLGKIAETHPITYLVGNHDCIPWYYFIGQGAGNIRVAERFTALRGALVAVHGHQYDPYNEVKVTEGQVRVPWTRRLVRAVGFLERVGGPEAGDLITNAGDFLEQKLAALENRGPDLSNEGLRHFLTGVQRIARTESPGERGYPTGESAYELGALGLLRSGARFVVMGHTHHPLVRKYGNRTYVNSGSWVWDRYPPTYARYSAGRLELLEANTHQPYTTPEGCNEKTRLE